MSSILDQQQRQEQMRGRLKKLTDQWSKGRVSLQQILGMDPEELYAIAAQGYFLFLEGKTEEARITFEGLVAIDPKNAYYYRALGSIYWRLKQPQKALKQFTYALRVAPGDIASYINRAEVHVGSSDYNSARADLRQALAKSNPAQQPLINKARAMMRMIQRA